ncbi:MAG: DUF4476 domain-containing protein [Flavipsychrobacter sp.]|nr:DUF4476 domain-containing protein [Flavipsychrobacter sp.]
MAQTFSYLYIQGDKETPIYVKMEDEMQPRYGKNYCIISQLAPGPVHIQVLFQQNVYPPQNFLIQVPENSYRGFIVTHKGDDFALYDLQQKIYIPAGNSIASAAAPATPRQAATESADPIVNTPAIAVVTEPSVSISATTAVASPAIEPISPTRNEIAARKAHIDSLVAVANTKKTKKGNTQPQFIDNMVLDNERTPQKGTYTIVTNGEPPPVITNSDCPTPLDNNTFEDMYLHMTQKQGDERLKFLMQNSKHCFSCNQVYILAKELDKDQQRYSFLKHIYPRVTDQANFKSMQNLFTSAEWESYFLLIVQ